MNDNVDMRALRRAATTATFVLAVNGQWKRPLSHAQFESLYSASEAEFIEAAAWTSRPSFDKPPKPAVGCLPLSVWYKVP